MTQIGEASVPAMLAAFDLGSWGRLSGAPVAAGRVGSIWRLDTDRGSWAVKQVGDVSPADLAEIVDGASFQEAVHRAGIPTPEVHRARSGEVIADLGGVRIRVHAWMEMEPPDTRLDPGELGRLLAGLHQVPFTGIVGVNPWYSEPVGQARWAELVGMLRSRGAPFADELAAIVPEIVELEGFLGPQRNPLRTCHRDLWADNLRRRPGDGLCVFDFDNAGLADPAQELAQVLVEYATFDPARASTIRAAYADAGGAGRVNDPRDFAMPIAQLGHIVEAGCRRWLSADTDAARADNEGWVREFLDRPLTRSVIDALLAG